MSKKKSFKKRQTRRKPQWQIDIVNERIEILFNLAKKEFDNNRFDLSKRYVYLARKISMKYNIPLKSIYKRQFCKKCENYLVVGVNATIRLNPKEKAIIMTCLDCDHKTRFGYSKE